MTQNHNWRPWFIELYLGKAKLLEAGRGLVTGKQEGNVGTTGDRANRSEKALEREVIP